MRLCCQNIHFRRFSHGEVATTMIGLICVGKPDFDAICNPQEKFVILSI